jgi:ATP-dependent RNA helicase DeaD
MTTFSDLGLSQDILEALQKLGFTQPTPIQAEAIPQLISSDQDVVALAQTGTGKTAAFSLPILHKTDTTSQEVQTLVLCPTRELCLQIVRDMQSFSTEIKGLRITAVYGGASITQQMRELKSGPQIVVGTPGRVGDMIRRNKLDLSTIKHVVLDEADEMLNMGFKEELDAILDQTPEDKQTLLFSATMAGHVERIAKNYMHDPLEIAVASRNEGNTSVSHVYVEMSRRDRYGVLRRFLDMHRDMYAIVFCETRNECKTLTSKLNQDGYTADTIHGELSQSQREHVMRRFRAQQVRLLVATDVAARGIDVNNLTHVINYSMPDQLENYVHRSGRTGRAGNTGTSIAFITPRERRSIKQLERHMKQSFSAADVPSTEDVLSTQVDATMKQFLDEHTPHALLEPHIERMHDVLAELPKEALIERIISRELGPLAAFYANTPKISAPEPDKFVGADMVSLKINIGKRDGIVIKDIFGLMNRSADLRSMKIGNIKMNQDDTVIEIPSDKVKPVTIHLKKSRVKGKALTVEETLATFGGGGRGRGGRSGRGGRNNYRRKRNSSGGRKRGYNRKR